MRPEAVTGGTVKVTAVVDDAPALAALAFNRMADTGVRFVPVIVTADPAPPIAGEMLVITGAKTLWFVTATEMVPVTEPAGSTTTRYVPVVGKMRGPVLAVDPPHGVIDVNTLPFGAIRLIVQLQSKPDADA